MKKIVCFLLGHKWDEWWRETMQGAYGHWCHRCKVWEFKQIIPSEKVIPFLFGYAPEVQPPKLYRLNEDGTFSEL